MMDESGWGFLLLRHSMPGHRPEMTRIKILEGQNITTGHLGSFLAQLYTWLTRRYAPRRFGERMHYANRRYMVSE